MSRDVPPPGAMQGVPDPPRVPSQEEALTTWGMRLQSEGRMEVSMARPPAAARRSSSSSSPLYSTSSFSRSLPSASKRSCTCGHRGGGD